MAAWSGRLCKKPETGKILNCPGRLRTRRLRSFQSWHPERKSLEKTGLSARLHAETLDDAEWRDDTLADTSFIESLVKVHRLCEVSCLYGFTRIEPAPFPFDEIQEDITLEVQGQSLADKVSWLPAMEQFGEGIFLKFNIASIHKRIGALGADNPIDDLRRRYIDWYEKDTTDGNPFPAMSTFSYTPCLIC